MLWELVKVTAGRSCTVSRDSIAYLPVFADTFHASRPPPPPQFQTQCAALSSAHQLAQHLSAPSSQHISSLTPPPPPHIPHLFADLISSPVTLTNPQPLRLLWFMTGSPLATDYQLFPVSPTAVTSNLA